MRPQGLPHRNQRNGRRPRVALSLKLVLVLLGITLAKLGSISSIGIGPMALFSQEKDTLKTITITSDSREPYHPSRVLVKFKGESGPRVIPAPNPKAAIARYQADSAVEYAEPDYIVNIDSTIPTDPLWAQQWDMAKIAAPQAWDTQINAGDVIVAVIDTGIDFTHPDLQANLWVNPANGSHGFTCLNGKCVDGGQDDYGHGTHVAGTIGAVANNGQGMAGINWRTQLLSCKFLDANGSGNMSDAILCFNKILALKQQGFNIRVTSNSWGGGAYSQALKDAMAQVEAAGILNVCAAGNSGVNADLNPMFPGAYDNRGIISVLASDSNDAGASFTNYGVANVDIAAPGVSTLSTVPVGSCPLCDPSGYRVASGTSMATPHVSAVLAAMFHINPALTADQARDVILDPASYDALTEATAQLTSTGGRLNFRKAITNPRLLSPITDNFPTVTGISSVAASAGSTVNLSATASDPDDDPLRLIWYTSAPSQSSLWLLGWMEGSIFPAPTGTSVSFQAPAIARTAVAPYALAVSDRRGGSSGAIAYATILPASSAGGPPSGTLSVSPTSGPVGTTVSVNFPATDPEGGKVGWDLWVTGSSAFGTCCQTGSSYSLPISAAGAYRISTQAIDSELNFSNRQTTVVRIGGANGTPPIANATFDTLNGPAPLTVNIDMTGSYDPDGAILSYITMCQYGINGLADSGSKTTCVYDRPGTYWILIQVKDNAGFMDVLSAYAVVTPPNSSPGGKTTASVTLSDMTQTYTGHALTPTATTNPPGLAITWTNAPQTAVGSYSVTATVNDPDYQGSASGTFVINSSVKGTATVTLSNLTQTYTGAQLTPTAITNPPGLAISWTNAPQTNPGTYSVTATVNDPNYEGSASGTFVVRKGVASIALSKMTQAYTGNALKPTATTTPPGLTVVWTNAPQTNIGAYSITATVSDPNYQGSSDGTFTITAPATPPSVSITSPTGGTVPSGPVTIQAAVVQGTNTIARVDFTVNGTVKCSDTSLPYTCAWNVPNARNKSYQLQVKAYDTAGGMGASSVVTVNR